MTESLFKKRFCLCLLPGHRVEGVADGLLCNGNWQWLCKVGGLEPGRQAAGIRERR